MKTADCHPNRKMQARGMCKPCYDRWLKESKPDYRDRQLKNTARWFRANPEKAAVIKERRKQKIAADPVERERVKRQAKNNMLIRKYGIGIEAYEEMLTAQGNQCAICSRKAGDKPLHVDHNHKTNKVRGFLCHQCNWYMGTIDASPEVLPRLLDYIKNDGVKHDRD